MIWRPAGRPELVSPDLTVAAGWPDRLKGYVKATAHRIGTEWPSISAGGGPPAAKASVGRVGVKRRSY